MAVSSYKKSVSVLGFETSCDETAICLLSIDTDFNVDIKYEVLASQIALHQAYGGVVPELAAREHIKSLSSLTNQAIRAIKDITEGIKSEHQKTVDTLMILNKKMLEKAPDKLLKQKEKQMNAAAKILDFETAAILRDEIKEIELLIEKKNKKEVKDEKERLKDQKKF